MRTLRLPLLLSSALALVACSDGADGLTSRRTNHPASSQTSSSEPAPDSTPDPSPDGGTPSKPAPVTTPDGGDPVHVDIDGPAVQPHVQVFADAVCAAEGECRATTYVGHDPSADLALDLPISAAYGKLPTDDGAFGDRVAAFALAHQAQHKIEYVIYRQRINMGSGWKAMEDRGSITQNHFDHVHVSFLP